MTSVDQSQGLVPRLLSHIDNSVAVIDFAVLAAQIPKGRDVTANFHYCKDSANGSPPAPNYVNPPSSYYRETLSEKQVVHDIRGRGHQYTLDTTGFQIFKHQSIEKDFTDDEQVKKVYYPETEELLKKA
jgi:hypothetical protein